MVYGIQKRGWGGGRILPNSRAIVLQQCGPCRRAEKIQGRLIRAQTTRSKTISCKGQEREKDSEAVLGVWLPAPLPTSRAPLDRGALWPLE